jgi:hypothetical protein
MPGLLEEAAVTDERRETTSHVTGTPQLIARHLTSDQTRKAHNVHRNSILGSPP